MKRARTRTLWIAAASLAAAVPVFSEDAPAPIPTPMQEQVLVQLVQMPIIALDRQGRPVTDLKLKELEISVRGTTVTRAYLDSLREPITRPGPLPDVRLFLDAPGGWAAPVKTSSTSMRYVAFLVDTENDEPLRRQEAMEKTLSYVDNELEAEVRAAVLSYSGTLELELPFTDDRAALKSALLRASAREGRPRLDPQTRMRKLLDKMDDCIVERSDFGNTGDPRCIRDVANEYIGENRPLAEDFVKALQGLVEYLGGIQGRKSVFVLSHGIPVDPSVVVLEAARAMFGNRDTLSELQLYMGFGDRPKVEMDRLLDELIRNRVTLTFVDRMKPPSGDVSAKRGQMLAPGVSPMRADYEAATADMEQIAFTSGGVHIQATDMTKALHEAFDAQRGAYELGFQTSEYLDSDRLAKVSVTCTRRGVKIFHRRGVYATPAEADQRMSGRIAFTRGRPLQGERAPGIHQPFRLEVDPTNIGYTLGETDASADFTVHFLVEEETGIPLADTYHFVSHAYDLANWNDPNRAPMTLSGWVELPPGAYVLRARIRNIRTGREGFVSQAVRVPEKIATPETSPPPEESKGTDGT